MSEANAISLPPGILPILAWGAAESQHLDEFLDDLAKIPAVPPVTPAVQPLANAMTVLAGSYDRFPQTALFGPHTAHASHEAAMAHYQAKIEAHKLFDGTLWTKLMANLPTIIAILGLFGIKLPPIAGLPTA